MHRWLRALVLSVILAIGIVGWITPAGAATFNAGDVVIYRVGDGNGQPREHRQSGVPRRVHAGRRLRAEHPSADGAQWSQSPSHRVGHGDVGGPADPLDRRPLPDRHRLRRADPDRRARGHRLGDHRPRTVARVDVLGNVDTTTALTDFATGNNPRSAASDNGTNLWVGGGAGGVRFGHAGRHDLDAAEHDRHQHPSGEHLQRPALLVRQLGFRRAPRHRRFGPAHERRPDDQRTSSGFPTSRPARTPSPSSTSAPARPASTRSTSPRTRPRAA